MDVPVSALLVGLAAVGAATVSSAQTRAQATPLPGTFAAGWRAVDHPAASLDLLAGVRATETDITTGAPVLALRGRVVLSDRISLTGYGDLGGGTSRVDSTWQLSATLDYHLSDDMAISAGYRYEQLYIDTGRAPSTSDNSGFLLGTRLRF